MREVMKHSPERITCRMARRKAADALDATEALIRDVLEPTMNHQAEVIAEQQREIERFKNAAIYLTAERDHRERCNDPEVCVDDRGPHQAWKGCAGHIKVAAAEKGWVPPQTLAE